jgi:CheY-like chemotaxis protein
VSLKILLADDNITAQRLGSKILTDAGHEVIAVSNGAAAVKKIASDKPDLLILDVFMPGYSGLEVCDKVKNDPATAQLPVILTVTNMEPFNPQDGHKVRSDGLMIKPFEASDLVAVVQKFASKSKSASKQADYAQTVKMAAMEEFKDASYEEWKAESTDDLETAKLEVPHDMAGAPALAFDEPAQSPQPMHVDEAPAPPALAVEHSAPAAFELPTPAAPPAFGAKEHAAVFGVEQPSPAFDLTAHSEAASPIDIHAELAGHTADATDTIDAHASLSAPVEFEPTSAAFIDVQVSQAAELESTLVSTPEVSITQDPALVTDADEMAQFVTKMGEEHPEANDITVGVALPGLTVGEPAPEPEPVAESPDILYATTVKMAAYNESESQGPASAPLAPSRVEEEMHRAFATSSSGAAAAPAFEPQPEPEATAPALIPDHLVQQFAAELDQAHEAREALSEAQPGPTVSEAAALEASMEIAKEIPASQLDEEKIAAAVNRALERYKEGLRAELIQAIIRELKG